MTLVWSGYAFDREAPLRDPECGTVMGGLVLEVLDGSGELHVFDTVEDDVEWAAACVWALEDWVCA